MDPLQELQKTLLIKGFLHKNIFDSMSLITCTDEIYIDHLPY